MKAYNNTPIQFHTNDGIGLRLANAATRKRLDRVQESARAHPAMPVPTGKVLEDVIALGSAALVLHVQRLLSGKPLEVMPESPNVTRLRVCGAVDYVIDRSKHCVLSQPAPLTRREKIASQQAPWHHPFQHPLDAVDVLNPLSRPAWLVHIAARPDWFGYAFARHDDGQDQLFVERDHMVYALSRVTRIVFYWMRHDPAFVALQHKLSTALTLHIGPGLVNLAMRARVQTDNVSLNARHLNLVWRHQQAYTCMEQENPRLLPLLTAWLLHNKANGQAKLPDALPAIRKDILASGLPPKAWRYLAHYGMKRLLPIRTNRTTWAALVDTLLALNAARWPLLPPRGFLRLLHDSAGLPANYDLATTDGAPGWFWQMACEEAFARRGDVAAYLDFFDRVPYLAWLVREFGLTPDQNQRRKKIAWLCEVAERHKEFAPQDDEPAWALWLQAASWDAVKELAVVPLLSRGALLKEAIALHNCVDSYADACRAETQLLLSLRDHRTGKRVALVGLKRSGDSWSLGQVAGPCNRPAPLWVKKVADQAAGVVRYHHSQRPPALDEPSAKQGPADQDLPFEDPCRPAI